MGSYLFNEQRAIGRAQMHLHRQYHTAKITYLPMGQNATKYNPRIYREVNGALSPRQRPNLPPLIYLAGEKPHLAAV